MAVHSKHPASEPPTAPVREKTGHLMLRAWCVFVLFIALATTAWYNLLGPVGLVGLAGAVGLVSTIVWIVIARRAGDDRPRAHWARLPWFPLAYVLWATASLLWTAWLDATAITLVILYATTLQGVFVAAMLTWRELIAAIASALKWVVGLSLVFELWVSVVVRAPLLPNFVDVPDDIPAELYWSRNNLFDGGRIQGIVGNANLLAIACLLAIIVFAIRLAADAPRRGMLIAWIVLSAYLMVRANSATAWLAAISVAVVLGTVLLMRTARGPGARTKWYLAYAAIAVGGGAVVWFARDAIFSALGRSSDLTGREDIWNTVLAKAAEHPVVGWGYSTPWIPWEPAFQEWIIDHDLTVFHAHNMWIDVFFQLGAIGLVIMIATYVSLIWRSWFFAVDRPRWDLRGDRPYTSLTLLPTLVTTVLLVQGFAESRPLMEWGWMFVVMLSFKIKQAPHIGVGPAEQSAAIERGELTWQVR